MDNNEKNNDGLLNYSDENGAQVLNNEVAASNDTNNKVSEKR